MPRNTCSLTPVSVRGKRRMQPNDSDTSSSRKRRPTELRTSRAVVQNHATPAEGRQLRKRRRTNVELSLLESLPVEMIQLIFQYSRNPDLPFVSRHLAAALARTQHLQTQFVTDLLCPVLGQPGRSVDQSALRPAVRILESRFVSLSFFSEWLRTQVSSLEEPPHSEDARVWWRTLQPAANVHPPVKLLSKPFTDSKIALLRIFASTVRNLPDINPLVAEAALAGLQDAIRQGSRDAVHCLLSMGLRVYIDTAMIRFAVMEIGCKIDIVDLLLSWGYHGPYNPNAKIDVLDEELWSWANHGDSEGNAIAGWLRRRLNAMTCTKTPAQRPIWERD